MMGWSAAVSFLQVFPQIPALKEGWRGYGAAWCAELDSWTEAQSSSAVKKPREPCWDEAVLSWWR